MISSTNIPSAKSNPSVNFLNVTAIAGDWGLTDMDLVLNQSDLSRAKFTVSMTRRDKIGYVEITNSTWGHVNASSGFEISVVHCYYTNIRTTTPLLVATLCKVTIKLSTFSQDMEGFVGLALLNATSTDAQMLNVNFNLGLHRDDDEPVIQVNDKSKLHMENCSVQFNGFACGSVVVFTKGNSRVTLINCGFFQKPIYRTQFRKKFFITYLFKTRCFPIFDNGTEMRDNGTNIYLSNSDFDISVSNYINHIITVDRSRVYLSECIYNSVDAISFAQNNSEIKAVRCKFDKGLDLAYTAYNTNITFYNCVFLQWKSLLGIIFNSTAVIEYSNITLNKPMEEVLIGLVNRSKVYLRNSHIANNFFESNFVVAKSKCLFVIEHCTYINNTEHNESSHFSFSDNTEVIVRNNDFLNNIGLVTLMDIQSSSIYFQGTTFHEKNQHQVSGCLTGRDSRVHMENCSIYCDETETRCLLASIIDLEDSALSIQDSIFNYDEAIHVEAPSKSVNVANSVFIQTIVCGAFVGAINIESSYFHQSGVVLMRMSVSRIANSLFYEKSNPAVRFSLMGGKILHLKTWNTSFKWENSSVQSNMTNFMTIAEKKGFIDVQRPSWINHTETVFGSRMYNFFSASRVYNYKSLCTRLGQSV